MATQPYAFAPHSFRSAPFRNMKTPTRRATIISKSLHMGSQPKPTQQSTPANQTSTTPQAQPIDPAEQIALAQALAAMNTNVGDLGYDYSTVIRRLGFQANLDPNSGIYSVGGIDPNNPYSQASLLQQNYNNAKARTTNSYAAAGQLYSGALQGQQGINTDNYNKGYDTLQKQVQDITARYLRGVRNAKSNYTSEQAIAPYKSLSNAVGR